MTQPGTGAGGSPYDGDAVQHGANPVPHTAEPVPRGPDPVVPAADPGGSGIAALPREARSFQGRRAGIVTRTVANIVDFSVVVGAIAGAYAAWAAITFLINPTKFSFPAPSFLILLVWYGLLLFAYLAVAWATTGRTYGDHLLGLRVVNSRGEPMRWAGAVIRSAFCVVLPIGLYWALLSPKNRSVQDAVLRTSVIYDWTTRRQGPQQTTSSD